MASLSTQVSNFYNTLREEGSSFNFPIPQNHINSDPFKFLNSQHYKYNFGLQNRSFNNHAAALKRDELEINLINNDTSTQSVILPGKHFLSELTESLLPKEIQESIRSNLCDVCGKAKCITGAWESSSVCDCTSAAIADNNYIYLTQIANSSGPHKDLLTSILTSDLYLNSSFNPDGNPAKKSKSNVMIKVTCPNCNKKFVNRGGLELHREFHCSATETTKLLCKICSTSCASPYVLKRHMRKIHKIKTTLEDVCQSAILSHPKNSEPGTTPKTETAAATPTKNASLRKNQDKTFFLCGICEKDFQCPSILKIHIEAIHSEFKIICKACDVNFTDYQVFKTHLSVRGNMNKYVCSNSQIADAVKKENESKPTLESNALTANSLTGTTNAFTANSLGANAFSANALSANAHSANALPANTHSANALPTNTVSANALSANTVSANALPATAFTCIMCNRTFPAESALVQHIQNEHMKVEVEDQANVFV